MVPTTGMDLDAIRRHLSGAGGEQYWRSLEELAQTAEFREFVEREFPHHASQWSDPAGRRHFLKLMGASLALAGLGGCTEPPRETIVPYVRAPEEVVPGKPLFFATAMTLGGYALGVLVESHMGRPVKIEGNSLHPASLGATDAFAQASILSLYDPDRSQTPMYRGRIDTWGRFLTDIIERMGSLRGRGGRGLRLLTPAVTSPTLTGQLRSLLDELPLARWHRYEPVNSDQVHAGIRHVFGRPLDAVYDFSQADVIFSLGADFLFGIPGSLRYAHDFSQRRRSAARTANPDPAAMSRLYVVEYTPTLTGAMADHRLPLRSSMIRQVARALAARLGVEVSPPAQQPLPPQWLDAAIEDLEAHRGSSLVMAGYDQSPQVHALVHAINAALGNGGRTVRYIEPVEAAPPAEQGSEPLDHGASLASLVDDMRAGRVDTLVMLGGNPVYAAPADLQFATALDRVAFRVHLSEYYDETSFLCHWHLPAAHYLESWSDARAYDGTATIVQPLIAPLYAARTAHEIMAILSGRQELSGYELVQEHWRANLGEDDFAAQWRRALHDGVLSDTQSPSQNVEANYREAVFDDQDRTEDELEVVFRPDPAAWDGRFANNGWLQELPKPLTKLVWDNAVLVSPETASRLRLEDGDLVELHLDGRSLEAPVWIAFGQAQGSLALSLGYGRWRAGGVGSGLGYDAYRVRTSTAPWSAHGIRLVKTLRRYPLVTTQDHWSMEGRDLVRVATLAEYHADPHLFQHGEHGELPSLYPEREYEGNAWGMVIDQTACIGCNACVVACQAENNIPIVGKAQVARGREMHWLRVDRYHRGDLDNPATFFQPLLCMHCEKAPCEVVCPVAATVHSSEGLNDMVYNRCVGTRYCSNNCPYKVRRFNFFNYTAAQAPVLDLLHNPDVTVRSRGVMEKCTYCVQRINTARIEAKKENRPIRDGEVVTACQAVCPAQAIVFGNILDRASQVHALKGLPTNYALLEHLNTQPRTTYLARLRNPNAKIEPPGRSGRGPASAGGEERSST